jgi:hypothetical protein
MIPSTVVVSPDQRGQIVVEAKGRNAERQLLRAGWTDQRSIWLAPKGWRFSASIIFPFQPKQGVLVHAFRFYDTLSDRNITICSEDKDPKNAMRIVQKFGWRKRREQWYAPGR